MDKIPNNIIIDTNFIQQLYVAGNFSSEVWNVYFKAADQVILPSFIQDEISKLSLNSPLNGKESLQASLIYGTTTMLTKLKLLILASMR